MRANAFDAIHRPVFAHQTVMYQERDFTADFQRRLHQQIERSIDRAFRWIFNWNNTEICSSCFCCTKYFVDRCARHALDRVTELLVDCLFSEGARRTKVCDCYPLFQRTAHRHDFAENRLHIARIQWSWIALRDTAQHLRFALWTKHRRIGFRLHMSHFLRQARAAVQQIENLCID